MMEQMFIKKMVMTDFYQEVTVTALKANIWKQENTQYHKHSFIH